MSLYALFYTIRFKVQDFQVSSGYISIDQQTGLKNRTSDCSIIFHMLHSLDLCKPSKYIRRTPPLSKWETVR